MICWICYEPIYVRTDRCQCIGDISFVHNTCLDQYSVTSKQSICRFCKTKYRYSSLTYLKSKIIDIWQSISYVTLLLHGFEMDIEDHINIH